jgi:hypothetical protein
MVVVYPDNVWYRKVTPEVLDRIVTEHLQHGTPVREHVYHQGQGWVNFLSGLSSSGTMRHTRRMRVPSGTRYKNHRFPAEIISHSVWRCFSGNGAWRAAPNVSPPSSAYTWNPMAMGLCSDMEDPPEENRDAWLRLTIGRNRTMPSCEEANVLTRPLQAAVLHWRACRGCRNISIQAP